MRVTPKQVAVVRIYAYDFAIHERDELVLSVDADEDRGRGGVLEVVLLPRYRTVFSIEGNDRAGWPTDQHHDLVFVSDGTTGIAIHA